MIQNTQLIHNFNSRQLMQTSHNNKRTYVRAMVLGALLLFTVFFAAVLATLIFDQDAHAATSQVLVHTYVEVQSGDTLWGIASQHAGDGQDVREYVHQLKAINGLKNVNIQLGQKLLLP
ncbi:MULTISPECIES: LysM peptidoglycan-binding domain-containing protein [unclassified Paenibacillus]|uniref:LysM peptidoglycan-binding domain-containing protein n=1 Tax=unclassified Paenibacillus TaxID=185978 RepID=UPI001B5BC9ED|nr:MULTISPECIES: LysM peptidoglycan-binding domain-containing protein [unclassified Paenibacillus]MBP1155461.1 LysM repeat protein [Paenibacillus sp. PvP091]MBP1169154.1 LysM repeat protein [Paenibacillus sp. PvR098]MBP2440182.1 LysM repeat protein [Paenibacillus sp. PvP052]